MKTNSCVSYRATYYCAVNEKKDGAVEEAQGVCLISDIGGRQTPSKHPARSLTNVGEIKLIRRFNDVRKRAA